MPKYLSDEIMRLKIIINGDDAQTEVLKLERANKQLGITLDSLNQRQKELSKTSKKDAQERKENQIAIDKLTLAMRDNSSKISATVKSMDIMSLTSSQLNSRLRDLNFTMSNMNPNDPGYKAAQEESRKLTGRLGELRAGAQGASTSVGRLTQSFQKYQGMAFAAVATFTAMFVALNKVITLNNKLTDAQTSVSKTTGLNIKEVQELTNAFVDFDTRTSKIDLLKIAETGGRLGIPKEEIKEFVREVDKANVALGDGFTGGVEEVTNTLGKLKSLYRETKDLDMATAINQIGSAMNELGAAGAASEENIGKFALRLGSLPDKLKPTVAEALALGAAFEESAIDAERSSTAYSSFIRTAAKDSASFAKVMGISKKEVEDLMNTDPLEFFLKFSEGTKGLDTTELAKMLDYLKLNDQYVISTMGAAAENTDRFRASIALSNKSLKEATSLQIEFDKVNNNAAATYDKLKNKFANIFTNEDVASTLNFIINTFATFIGVNIKAEEELGAFGRTFLAVARIGAVFIAMMFGVGATVATYNLLIKESIVSNIALEGIQKIRNATTAISNSIQNAWNLTLGYSQLAISKVIAKIGFQTAATNLQTTAQERLNLVTKQNPLGLILSVIAIAVTAYMTYKAVISDTTVKLKSLNAVLKEGVADAGEEISKLEVLYKTATNVKNSTEDRTTAVKKLKAEFPSYFGQIADEVIMNGKASRSYHELRAAIVSSSRAKAAEGELQNRQADRLKRDEEWNQRYAQEIIRQGELKARGSGKTKIGDTFVDNSELVAAGNKRLKNLYDERFKFKKQDIKNDEFYIKAINENNKKAELYNKDNTPDINLTTPSDYTTPGDEKKSKADSAKRTAEKLARLKEQHDKEMAQIAQDGENAAALARQIALNTEDATISAMEEGYEKELALINLQEQRKMAEIDKQKRGETEISLLQKKIDKAKQEDKFLFESLMKSWKDNNEALEKQKLQEEKGFINKKKTLREKYQNIDFKNKEEVFQQEMALLDRQKNEEIVGYETLEDLKKGLKGRMKDEDIQNIKTWAEGKEALNKIYQKREIELQIAHMEVMIAMYEGLDLSILSKEQQEQILKFLDDAKNGVAKLKATAKGKDDDTPKELSLGQNTQTDILGMSPENWVSFFKNIDQGTIGVQTVQAAIGALQQASAMYYQFVEANEKRQLQNYERATEKKKRTLKTQLQSGYINQATYKKLDLQADEDLQKKKFELELSAAKRQKMMAISQTIANTAMSIMSIWAQFPKFDFGATAAIMSGVVGALGAVQVATIASQPLPSAPGAEDGYYPVLREQDNKRFNARKRQSRTGMYDEPTMLVGEAGKNFPELVVAGNTLKRINPQIQQNYMQEISRVEGFEKGLTPDSVGSSSSNDEMMMRMMSLIEKNIEVLQRLDENGVVGIFDNGPRTGKVFKESIKSYEKLENKSKH